jgi:nucleoside-diphosphate-sugar epimerase
MRIEGNVLITGATGFVGGELIRTLLSTSINNNDFHIYAIGRNTIIGKQLECNNCTFIQLDLSDSKSKSILDTLCEEKKFTHIVHCAALCTPWNDPKLYYKSNVLSTKYLAESVLKHCRNSIRKFVFISSPSIFSASCFEHKVIKEDTPVPNYFLNEYSRTKYKAEKLMLEYYGKENGLPVIVLRPRAIYGPGDTTLLPLVIKKLSDRRMVNLKQNGEPVYTQLTHVKDVVQSIVCAMECDNPVAIGRAFNITGEEIVDFYELFSLICKRFLNINLIIDSNNNNSNNSSNTFEPKRLPFNLIYYAGSLFEMIYHTFGWYTSDPPVTRYTACLLGKSLIFDISDARDILGYKPSISFEQGVQQVLDTYNSDIQSKL